MNAVNYSNPGGDFPCPHCGHGKKPDIIDDLRAVIEKHTAPEDL